MNNGTVEIISQSVAETIELGKKIGRNLKGGEVICLEGIASGAGFEDTDEVNSPTFVMVNEYPGRFDIYHIDAYRIESIAEFETLGFSDFIGPGSIILIEWASKVAAAVADIECINIEMEHAGDSVRKILISNAPNIC